MPEPQDLRFLDFERFQILQAIIPKKAQSVRDITTSHNLRVKLKPSKQEREELTPEGAPEGSYDLSRIMSGDFQLVPHDALTEREISFLLDCVQLKQQQEELPNTDEMYGILMGDAGEENGRPGLLEYDEDGRFDV